VLSYDFSTTSTRGLWFANDRNLQAKVLTQTNTNIADGKHPLLLPYVMFRYKAKGIQNSVSSMFAGFDGAIEHLKLAYGNNYVDGFEHHFLVSCRAYYRSANTSVEEDLEETLELGKFMLETIESIRIADEYCNVLDTQIENSISLNMKRLEGFKKRIAMKRAGLERQFGIVGCF